MLSLTDPFYIAYMSFNDDKHWFQIDRSEVIHDDLNPKFSKPTLIYDYMSLKHPQIKNVFFKFDIYDEDDCDAERLDVQEYVGTAVCCFCGFFFNNNLPQHQFYNRHFHCQN